MKHADDPQYSQEIRYAVVMYGGVSLAIYMNGIAQEMLRLVRATSAEPEKLSGTEKIYRELACRLHLGREPGDSSTADAPQTRFVIDLLSGTSAGGINAVFLAKALAQKTKNLEGLRKLWMDKADIETLLNDKRSEENGRFQVTKPKKSLLNSRRMYGLLRDAFDQMDGPEQTDETSAGAPDRIDLYVTATDLNGLVVPIEMTDKPLLECAHRSVFHFRYDPADEINELSPKYNPMLAFAARCTSSFPVAFEPMKFENIEPKLPDDKIYQHFFDSYSAPGLASHEAVRELDFQQRIFADGGYLDNRPFSYVIDQIAERTATTTAYRKLLFVDPFPEHLDRRTVSTEINFAQNAILAASKLPRYETIREDLARINEMNRRAARLGEIKKALFSLDPTGAKLVPPEMKLGIKYGKIYMSDMLEDFGPLFVTDQLIKVSAISDWLALIATRHLGLNESGDYYRVVRLIVRAWREDNFVAIRPRENQNAKDSETEFIRRYDLDFRLSRLRYLIFMIDRVALFSDAEFGEFRNRIGDLCPDSLGPAIKALSKEDLMTALARVRIRQSKLLIDLYKRKCCIEARRQTMHIDILLEPLVKLAEEVRDCLSSRNPLELLKIVDADQQREAAQTIYASMIEPIQKYFDALAGLINQVLDAAHTERNAIKKDLNDPDTAVSAVAYWLHRLWDSYEIASSVIARILPKGQIGESGTIEIFRIGPGDTDLTIRDTEKPEEKLAGAKLGAFGAFLAEGWRENDILWGRLDGAERLIVSLLPDDADENLRADFIERIRNTILEEEFNPENGRIYRWLAGQVRDCCGSGLSKKKIAADINKKVEEPLKNVLNTLQTEPHLWQSFLREYYDIPRGPQRTQQAKWMARSVRISGEMLEGMEAVKGFGGKLRIAGMILLELVQVSLPGSLRNFWFSHLLGLLMLTGGILILLGTLFSSDFSSVGLRLLLYSGSLWLIIRCLRSWLSYGPLWKRVLIAIGAAVGVGILAFAAIGFGQLPDYIQQLKAWLSKIF